MIERIHLRVFKEIEQQGSLTAAAKSLHLTQSALSHAIKKLEDQIGTPLWIKKGRSLQFTQAGQFLLSEANRLLPQLERIDQRLTQYASNEQGSIGIGMECHPCYQWLLRVVQPFLADWPGVDLDVKQQFKFGGMAALFNHDIDILVTPDPLIRRGIRFVPVFGYEQVLVVGSRHAYAKRPYIEPVDLIDQVLYTYPVETARLDIFSQFLVPAQCRPHKHKLIETTEIMLQLVLSGRGVASLPGWLVTEYRQTMPVVGVRLGKQGVFKQINLGIREDDLDNSQVQGFMRLAKQVA